MGSRNRERRKVKQRSSAQKARRNERRHSLGSSEGPHNPFAGASPEAIVGALMTEAIRAIDEGNADAVDAYVDALADRPGDAHWFDTVDRALLAGAQAHVRAAWARGWLPADLHRLTQRQYGAAHGRVLLDVIAAQLRQYPASTIDERWTAQLEGLGATVWWHRDDMVVSRWWMREGVGRAALIHLVLQLGHLLLRLPDIGRLGPLPGEARAAAPRRERSSRDAADQRVLDRVRALLAKAESTEFPEEAEVLTAKAQELMARHSIDEALLAVRSGGRSVPTGVRLGIDNPYESAKALLLQEIAAANGCRAVWSKEFGFCTVVGFETDLKAVELLYTSLLVQGIAAIVRAGARRDAHGRSRTRSFRQSFLTAYAIRIGERMRDVVDDASQEVAAAEGADNLLPVLAARDDDVRRAMDYMFPHMRSSDVTIGNREGWASGRAAANLATLLTRREVTQPRTSDRD
jgi:hypothetical protein